MVRDIVLVHGLWMPGLVMSPLAARIARADAERHAARLRQAGSDVNVYGVPA